MKKVKHRSGKAKQKNLRAEVNRRTGPGRSLELVLRAGRIEGPSCWNNG